MNSLEFDYIIVGAGSAGCVLAEGLSANGRHKVLVIEAGGSDSNFWIKVPVGYGVNFANPRLNWSYHAAPDPGLDNRTVYWPRGRVIGGSSSINAMAYVRGLPRDFEDWVAAGAVGFGWQSVRQTYDALESNSEIDAKGNRRRRGTGPLWVSDMRDQMHPFSRRFLRAAEEMGWSVFDDLNGDNTGEGLAYFRSTVRNGRRFSAADAFLRPARKRANLKVVSNALVEGLELEDGRATGVHYRKGGGSFVAKARAEVILSAGAVNSPQILQLSGIGPAALLRAHGIEVRHGLEEVGQGLQDHLAISYHFEASEPTLNAILGSRIGQCVAGLRYLATRRGPLCVPVNQVGGFVRSDLAQASPDMQLFCNPVSYETTPSGKPRLDKTAGYILCAQPCRPTSRGAISIASARPDDAPTIVPNSLSTDEDRASVLRGVKLLRQLASVPSLAEVTRGRKAPDILSMSEEEMLADFRRRASTVFHPTCTCRMGHDASDSVVDHRLRVHGIRGLRVVDASAFPNITSGNTNAPTMMLARRAVDLILRDAGSLEQ